jgi:protein associated with RNAse G/E
MNPGDTIIIRQLHADGACYRWHTAFVEHIETDGIVIILHKGMLIHQDSGNWEVPFNMRGFLWWDKWYTLEETYDEQGALRDLYININAPPTYSDHVIEYIDYELDVSKEPGVPAVVLDEDEFAEAIVKYSYSESHQQQCWAAVQAGLALAEVWQPRGWNMPTGTSHVHSNSQ